MLAATTWRSVHEYWTCRDLVHERTVLLTDASSGSPKIFDVAPSLEEDVTRLWGTRTVRPGVLWAGNRSTPPLGVEFSLFDALERFAGRIVRGERLDRDILVRDMGRLEAIGVAGCYQHAQDFIAAAGDDWWPLRHSVEMTGTVPQNITNDRRLELAKALRLRLAAARGPG